MVNQSNTNYIAFTGVEHYKYLTNTQGTVIVKSRQYHLKSNRDAYKKDFFSFFSKKDVGEWLWI